MLTGEPLKGSRNMGDFFETALAVQLGMQMANQQSYQKIEPSPYDDRELAPQIDLDLPTHDCYMQMMICSSIEKTLKITH